ncbi:MAG TPA: hypothetical protein VF681_11805 [Abditibacteriaceae bacterium]|jgi:hypothetical protein
MNNTTPGAGVPENGATSADTEIAGQATVDSQPSERSSDDGENGLDADAENGVHLPGPLINIDEA